MIEMRMGNLNDKERINGAVSGRSHNNMSHIHGNDTCIEILLRKALWEKGYRY